MYSQCRGMTVMKYCSPPSTANTWMIKLLTGSTPPGDAQVATYLITAPSHFQAFMFASLLSLHNSQKNKACVLVCHVISLENTDKYVLTVKGCRIKREIIRCKKAVWN